ncbi:MAG: YARHG domain-containing protein, partial [Clostridiales bacterium]|nr:YARHG domain-containing protein [Candidatus Blautia equi]
MKKRCTAFIYALLFVALFAGSGFLSKTVKAEPKAYDLILPDADVKVYTEEEVEDMPAQVIRYAINEIHARRGRLFASEELREYFELQPWYFGNIDPLDFTDDFL